MEAADLEPLQLSGVHCAGGTSALAHMGRALRDRLGVEPMKVLPAQTAAMQGAARTSPAAPRQVPAAYVPPSRAADPLERCVPGDGGLTAEASGQTHRQEGDLRL